MALNFSFLSLPTASAPSFPNPNHSNKQQCLSNFKTHHSVSSFLASAVDSQRQTGGVTEDDAPAFSGPSSTARTQLDLLEQLTSNSSAADGYQTDGSSQKLAIRNQLAMLVGDRDDDFIIPLGKNLKKVSPKFLTVSQKRNIRRQAYLDEVSQRNDTVFFATIGAFVILPPIIILGIAILTGYVQLFP